MGQLWFNSIIIITLLIIGLTSAVLSLYCTIKNIDNKFSKITSMVSNLCIGIVILLYLIGKYVIDIGI